VNSKREKRRAEDIAEQVSGVTNVQNHLRVGQQQNSNTQWSNTVNGNSGEKNSLGTSATLGSQTKTKSE